MKTSLIDEGSQDAVKLELDIFFRFENTIRVDLKREHFNSPFHLEVKFQHS